MHTFGGPDAQSKEKEGLQHARAALIDAQRSLEELDPRRTGLLVALGIIILVLIGPALKIRTLRVCSLLLIALAALDIRAAVSTLPCGKVRVNKQKGMRSCTLEADGKFAGAVIPQDSIVFFTADGAVAKMFLARDTAIAGHVCRGGADAWETGFYPNGRLKLCWLAKEEVIDGIRCRRATFLADVIGGRVGVWLHDDGHLSQCEAVAGFVIGSCRVKKGDTVNSDATGNISVRGVTCGRATSR